MYTHKVKVGKNRYTIVELSAFDQVKLLERIGGAITARSVGVKEINKELIAGVLLGMKDIASFGDEVLYKTIKAGDKNPVEVGGFQGKMGEYLELVAAAVEVNLKDFFTYLQSAKQDARAKESEA